MQLHVVSVMQLQRQLRSCSKFGRAGLSWIIPHTETHDQLLQLLQHDASGKGQYSDWSAANISKGTWSCCSPAFVGGLA